jgi:hypothetical protein
MRSTIKAHLPVRAILLSFVVATALLGATSKAQADLHPYWFSWSASDCETSGNAIDPISTYFVGPAAKGGRVRHSLIGHLGGVDPRWYEFTLLTLKDQWFRHYDGTCIGNSISMANGPDDQERMHIRGAQVASPVNQGTFMTGLTPHYELWACGGHNIAYAGAPTRDGGRVRNGGYVYPRIKLEQAYGNGRRRAFPFHWYQRNDNRTRHQCTWYVADGGTVVQIGFGN